MYCIMFPFGDRINRLFYKLIPLGAMLEKGAFAEGSVAATVSPV